MSLKCDNAMPSGGKDIPMGGGGGGGGGVMHGGMHVVLVHQYCKIIL